jgi:hypothetical protein
MNYKYVIKNQKIYEFEGQEITYDCYGHSIQFLILIENVEKTLRVFTPQAKRKIKWLKENHPELLI